MKIYRDLYGNIISPENLFAAWGTFKQDKRNKLDVATFERHLEENIFQLHRDLKNKTYRHGTYEGFYIHDPKQRHIHKATVRDRILHHAVFSVINPIFEETFIQTSFSCRVGFGTHRGVDAVERMLKTVNRNAKDDCFALKCDVRKFFDSVDHTILLNVIKKRIKDGDALWLLREIIESYRAAPVRERERERESKPAAAPRDTHREPDLAAFRECLYERIRPVYEAYAESKKLRPLHRRFRRREPRLGLSYKPFTTDQRIFEGSACA